MNLDFRKFFMADNNDDKKPPKNPKGSGPKRPDYNFDGSKILRRNKGYIVGKQRTGQAGYHSGHDHCM